MQTSEIVSLIRIQFAYIDGEVSLDEAVTQMKASGSDCTETTLRELLLSAPRFNVLHLHEDTKHGEAIEQS